MGASLSVGKNRNALQGPRLHKKYDLKPLSLGRGKKNSEDSKNDSRSLDLQNTKESDSSENKSDSRKSNLLPLDPRFEASFAETPRYELMGIQTSSRRALFKRPGSTSTVTMDLSKRTDRFAYRRSRKDSAIQCAILPSGARRDMLCKFIQAGVGHAFMRDNESNTIKPIFPCSTQAKFTEASSCINSYNLHSVHRQAFGDQMCPVKCTDNSTGQKETVAENEEIQGELTESAQRTSWKASSKVNIITNNYGEKLYGYGNILPTDEYPSKPQHCCHFTEFQSDCHMFDLACSGCQNAWASLNRNGGVRQPVFSNKNRKVSSPSGKFDLSRSRSDSNLYSKDWKQSNAVGAPKVISRSPTSGNLGGKKFVRNQRSQKDRLNSGRNKPNQQSRAQLENKFRFYVRESDEINKMLGDPDDRRIRTICERFQCDLDIYAKNLIAGFMQYTVDIEAPNATCLLGCVRNLDSALGWHIAPQLMGCGIQKKD
ncbi:unnamed protein product [Mesocestoides corti]|uniref:Uncharacterized protein n=2 Tax=Mesocestoides corti TaxID=53468 RepID=A0A0R3U1D4_MESCO|nr:unnamed protein product [Mesocestoides corti]